MNIRKASPADLPGVEKIYDDLHDAEESGLVTIGWIRGVYPTRATAGAALDRGDLYVMEEDGQIYGAALINRIQVEEYSLAKWEHNVPDDQIYVLHTLVISPAAAGRGLGKQFVQFYEDLARKNGISELRIDTNEKNSRARAMYKKLGYEEIDIIPVVFNGIPDVNLVLLEKYL